MRSVRKNETRTLSSLKDEIFSKRELRLTNKSGKSKREMMVEKNGKMESLVKKGKR